MVIAKKRFGQNFLIDRRKAAGMIDCLDLSDGDSVIEIGSGTGVLTELLLEKGVSLLAVEIDRDLITGLKERFGHLENFKLIESDILKLDLRELMESKVKVIGNLPYNISTAVVEWLIEYYDLVELALITVQKEVADRLRALPGRRDYGSLSVIAQSFFKITRAFSIPPGCFSPRPKVDSTVLVLKPDKRIDDEIPYGEFRDFVRQCFAGKRKKLTNSLAAYSELDKNRVRENLRISGFSEDIRAEEIALDGFYKLFRVLSR